MNFSSTPLSGTQHSQINNPLRLGIAGLSHDHVRWIFDRKEKDDVIVVGIAEPDEQLAAQYINTYNLESNLFYKDLEEMLDAVKPEAVCAFNSIFHHLEVVEKCAPRKIHVMVEKPLAINSLHASKMNKLAKENGILLLTNFQTSWFPSTHFAYDLAVNKEALGDVWKVVIHDGHKGPVEKGCSPEFVNWLTDPEKNGGGAIVDFGCYGPNIMTWMMKGEKPVSVTAFCQNIKPEVYPKVDDEAVIILEYNKVQALIQASWNWPINRKDLEIYGKTGQLIAEDHQHIRIRKNENTPEEIIVCPPMEAPFDDPFSYFAAIISGAVKIEEYDLSSIKVNLIVTEIMDAAIESAKKGKKILLSEYGKD